MSRNDPIDSRRGVGRKRSGITHFDNQAASDGVSAKRPSRWLSSVYPPQAKRASDHRYGSLRVEDSPGSKPRTQHVSRSPAYLRRELETGVMRQCIYVIDVRQWRILLAMVIKETSVFTKRVEKLLDRESYRLLQLRLVTDPEAGDLMKGTGGLRKIRWQGSGRGKRGGVRVIYYWVRKDGVILMLLVYGKNEQDDLTAEQRAVLKRLVEEELK